MLMPIEIRELEQIGGRITRATGLLIGCAVMAVLFAVSAWLQCGPWLLWGIIATCDSAIAAYVGIVLWRLFRRREALEALDFEREVEGAVKRSFRFYKHNPRMLRSSTGRF